MSGGERETEIRFEVEAKTPEVLGLGGKVRFAISRRNKRVLDFAEQVVEEAQVSEEDVADRIAEDEVFADLLVDAAEGAARHGEPTIRHAFAHLIAGAFHNGARFSSEACLLSKLRQLEPIHLRVMDKIEHTPPALLEENIGSSGLRTTRRAVAQAIEADRGVVHSAMTDLVSLGIATANNPASPGPAKEVENWRLTGLGQHLMDACGLYHPIESEMLKPPGNSGRTG
jgi:hypothetical protein